MALIYHPSVAKQKDEIIAASPEMKSFFERIEKWIATNPELGLPERCLLESGKTVQCFKQSIEVYLFSGRIRYGRSQLSYTSNNLPSCPLRSLRLCVKKIEKRFCALA